MTAEEINDLKQEEQGKGEHESDSNWIPGLVLIGLGLFFLLNNFVNIRLFENWWALFILIPAFSNLNSAWKRYRAAGAWTESAVSALTGGLLIGAVAMIFLFNLSFGTFWPVLLIILGFSILVRKA